MSFLCNSDTVCNKVAVISGLDYSDAWPGVKKAVDEFFGQNIKIVGTLWAQVL